MQEKQIIAGIKAKDRLSTEYLYEKYSRALFAVICRIVPDQRVAEDVFHDSFLTIARKIESYDESQGCLYSWMSIICKKLAAEKILRLDDSKLD